MIVLAGAILGALAGGIVAARRGGGRLDIAQYAAVYMLIFALAGLFITCSCTARRRCDAMFLPFFEKLREAGIPVSLREYLTFLEAVKSGLATV